MKRNNLLKKVSLFLAIIMLFLSGCGTGQKADENETAKTEEIKQESTYDYQNVVLDKSLVENKLAVYYFNSAYANDEYDGSGDCVLIIAPNGTTMMIDTNFPTNTAYVVYALQELGIEKIDYFVNSHPHDDHLGGFSTLARYIDIGHVYIPPCEAIYEGSNFRAPAMKFQAVLEQYDIPFSRVVEGDVLTLGEDVTIKVYNPPAEGIDYTTDAEMDENEWSLVFKMTYGESSYFFGGDIGDNELEQGRATISELMAKYGEELSADVIKMNHHGSKNTKSQPLEYLKLMNAKVAVGMGYKMPNDTEYFKYISVGATTFHTALDGTILVSTTGDGTYDVQVEKDRITAEYGMNDTKDGHIRIQ